GARSASFSASSIPTDADPARNAAATALEATCSARLMACPSEALPSAFASNGRRSERPRPAAYSLLSRQPHRHMPRQHRDHDTATRSHHLPPHPPPPPPPPPTPTPPPPPP